MRIKMADLPVPQVYFTMTQLILPRPIAWVMTENDNASYNLAPYSYFNGVSSDPAILMFSSGLQEDGSEKDSLRNIRERENYVIHIASDSQLADLNQTSATLPPGVSDVDKNSLSLSEEEGQRMPRLTDSKIAFFCKRYDIQQIGNSNQMLVFGEVEEVYVADDCAGINEKGRFKVDATKVRPLSRLGASEYASFGEIMMAQRPA